MAIAKWFPKLTPTTPLAAAARTVLEERSAGVEHYLKLLAHRTGDDPEYVHQLRVATRRLAAALSIFKSCLDRRARRQLRRAAKKLRSAAGSVRDWDVQRLLLQQRLKTTRHLPRWAMEACQRELEHGRRSLERHLKLVMHRWSPRLAQSAAAVLQSLDNGTFRVQRVGNLATAARVTLRKRLKQMRSAGRRDLHDLDHLHQLRIAAKRLRYAMEIFAACYPREFRHELYREVERLQDDLGDVNDLRNLKATLAQIKSSVAGPHRNSVQADTVRPLHRLIAELSRDLLRRKSQFVDRWTGGKELAFFKRFERIQNAPLRPIIPFGQRRLRRAWVIDS